MKLKILTLLIIIITSAVYPAKIFASYRTRHIARLAINTAFCGGGYKYCERGREAWNVADCETGHTFNVYAGYGKHPYWGIFQFGPMARNTFGFAWNAWAQARAARRYYNYSLRYNGYGWEPWSCLPY